MSYQRLKDSFLDAVDKDRAKRIKIMQFFNAYIKPLMTWFSKWTLIDFGAYISEVKRKIVHWCIAVFIVHLLFEKPVVKFVDKYFISSVLSQIKRGSILADVCLLTVVIFSAVYFAKQIGRHLLPNLNSILIALTVTGIYFVTYRFNSQYHFYSFLHFNVLYGDVFLMSILLWAATYKGYFKSKQFQNNQYALIGDSPSLTEYNDAYKREEYAETLTKHIAATYSSTSFAIAVVGDWGSGKSDFLLRIKSRLEKNREENIVFEFNPWRVKTDSIVDEFFKVLSENIRPYNQSITPKIRDYSKRILQPSKELQYRFLDTLIGEWYDNTTIQEEYDQINRAVKATGKKIVIIVDDLDRLTGKEVMEVIRIIRNTANFGNTFFIAGVDQRYLVSVLQNTKDFANEEEYLKKVFQLTVTLPTFKKELLASLALELLVTTDLSSAEQEQIRSAIESLSMDTKIEDDLIASFMPHGPKEELFEQFIDNIRDLKRFANSFKVAFGILKTETDIRDVFVLELIRNKSIEVYNAIRTKRVLRLSTEKQNQYELNWESWADDNLKTLSLAEKTALKSAVTFLINGEGKNARRFALSYNFYLYFSYQLFNQISFREFNFIVQQAPDEIVEKFGSWISDNKFNELTDIVDEFDDFFNGDFLHKMVAVFLRLADFTARGNYWFNRAEYLIFTRRVGNRQKYFPERNEEYKSFIRGLMSDATIPLYNRAYVASRFLLQYTQTRSTASEDSEILDKQEWQNIVLDLFQRHLETIDSLGLRDLAFLYLNDYGREGSLIILNPDACELIRDKLLKNEDMLRGYLRLLFRPYDGIEGRTHSFEPFITQIFPKNSFIELLETKTFENEDLNKLKRIAIKYFPQYLANRMVYFKIDDPADRTFIDEWMRKVGITTQ